MQNATLLWHVSLLAPDEQKALALGGLGFARFVPVVALSLLGGLATDAWDRRRLMLATQIGAAAVAAGLAVMTWHGMTLPALYSLAALGAAFGAFDVPARQALVPTLVPREDLPGAISLNAFVIQAASVGGPALGGLLIVSNGVGWAYMVNALSYGFVIGAVLLMRSMPGPADHRRAALSWDAVIEGFRFAMRTPVIRATLLLDFFGTFFSAARSLLPIFAQDVLLVGPVGYGWLYAGPAIGAVATSALMVPLVTRVTHRGRVLVGAVTMYGAATVAFGASRWFWLAFVCLVLTGVADAVAIVLRNTIRQLETPDHLRGRLSAVSMLVFQGSPRLGDVQAGALAYWIGAPAAVIAGGIGCLAATQWVAARTSALKD